MGMGIVVWDTGMLDVIEGQLLDTELVSWLCRFNRGIMVWSVLGIEPDSYLQKLDGACAVFVMLNHTAAEK
jgi:hypothetical protein